MARIFLSSSICSGLYACVELLLALNLSWFLTIVIRCWNLKRIYNDRGKNKLFKAPLGHVIDCGPTSGKVQYCVLFISLLIMMLTAVGGFSITGETGRQEKIIEAKGLVREAAPGHLINYSHHIAFQDTNCTTCNVRISLTVLLAREHLMCAGKTTQRTTVFQYFSASGAAGDLKTPKWSVKDGVNLPTCLTGKSGYAEKIALSRKRRFCSDCHELSGLRCAWIPDSLSFPPRSLTYVEKLRLIGNECPFEFESVWCFANGRIDCMGLMRVDIGYSTTYVAIYRKGSTNVRFSYESTYIHERPVEDVVLQSAVALLATGVTDDPDGALFMSLLTVDEKAPVTKLGKSRDETVVNEVLLAVCIGSAVVITLSAGIIAFWCYLEIVAQKRRFGYNRFTSAMDLLSSAAFEAFKDGGSRFSRSEVLVGLDELDGNHLRPLKVVQ